MKSCDELIKHFQTANSQFEGRVAQVCSPVTTATFYFVTLHIQLFFHPHGCWTFISFRIHDYSVYLIMCFVL